VLDEKALVMAGEPSGGSKNPWAVRGADAEYNAWRYGNGVMLQEFS
jgi:hypothetical protein